MALKVALLSFEFINIKELKYEPSLNHDFADSDPTINQSIQPIIEKAFSKIKQSISAIISSSFTFSQTHLQNVNNFLHVGMAAIDAEVQHADGSYAQTSTMFIAKFYRLEPNSSYKVTLDIEEMPSSSSGTLLLNDNLNCFEQGNSLNNDKLTLLAKLLDKKFKLQGKIECIPMIKRGRCDKPHYLVASDERILEYDFKELLYHKQSQYQDVKIVSSPSLGNTLLLDNLQNYSENDLPYTQALMDYGKIDYKDKEILILGGGDAALLWELLKEKPKYVTMAEIDPVVIEACRDHLKPFGKILEEPLEGTNYKIHVDDCMKILQNSYQEGKRFDFIFNDLTDIPVGRREESHTAFQPNLVQKDNPWHFIEAIFYLALDCLKEDGLYLTHTTGSGNSEALKAYEDFLSKSRIAVDYESRSCCVPSYMEIWVFYTIRKRKSLVDCSQVSQITSQASSAETVIY